MHNKFLISIHYGKTFRIDKYTAHKLNSYPNSKELANSLEPLQDFDFKSLIIHEQINHYIRQSHVVLI